MRRVLFGALLAAGACRAAAGDGATGLEAGVSTDALNHGYADWSSRVVRLDHSFGERQTAYLSYLDAERFSQQEGQTTVGLYYPLAARWDLQAEANVSDGVLFAKRSSFADLRYGIGEGWGAHAGYRRSDYTDAGADTLSLGLERYVGSFFGGWTGQWTRFAGSDATSHLFRLRYYYSERDYLEAVLANGREINQVSPDTVLISDVTTVAIAGRHWVDPRWAVVYEAWSVQQNRFYDRQGVSVGIRCQF